MAASFNFREISSDTRKYQMEGPCVSVTRETKHTHQTALVDGHGNTYCHHYSRDKQTTRNPSSFPWLAVVLDSARELARHPQDTPRWWAVRESLNALESGPQPKEQKAPQRA